MRTVFLAIVLLARAYSALGQTPPPLPSSPSQSGVTITVGYEVHRDHLRYRFENPSSLDTSVLVPHSFEQRYVADNQWLVGSIRYPLFHQHLESEFAVTPERTTTGSDFDTFQNPGNDTIVTGTAGDVHMRSLRVTQWSEGRLWGVAMRVGYSYRRDQADFLPADVVTTHTNPRSDTRRFTTDRERTISEVHELPLDASKTMTRDGPWRAIVGASVSPIVFARLTTILPEKYPGQDIVFHAQVVDLGARVQLIHQRGRWPLVIAARYGRTWSYTSGGTFDRRALQLSVRLGFER